MAIDPTTITITETTPYAGQKPGTSGLRKKVKVFRQENYLANFVQALFNSLDESEYKNQTLLVSGDGRYWNKAAIHIIAEIAAGNGVRRLWVGQNGWMSTPAASAVIRMRDGGICKGGILLTASHNPGGPNEDFGIKYNCFNGEPAPEKKTEAIYQAALKVSEIRSFRFPVFDMTKQGVIRVHDNFEVEVIDPTETWVGLMRKIFDFDLLKGLISNPKFSFVYDGMNGIGGPYAKRIFVDELGAAESCLMRCVPLEDFGGCHPDPNLTYAKELVAKMRVGDVEAVNDENTPVFGAAGDGDCDRNMILGRGWFVTPSDSVAIMAAHVQSCVPYFKHHLTGVARSMPTSLALKNVADKMGLQHYEVPTGWKFFGNLMDSGLISLCGEESFGTGSDHVREKDGLWAVLIWMSILAYNSKDGLTSVKAINEAFWTEYGRNYYTRYDYENVETEQANAVLAHTQDRKTALSELSESTKKYLEGNQVADINVFEYKDPVDGSISSNQGVRCIFKDGSRFVLRLSGTGSSGATIRLYIERFQKPGDMSLLVCRTADALKELVSVALDISKIQKLTGRQTPSVIT